MSNFYGCYDIWDRGRVRMTYLERVRRARRMFGLAIQLGRYTRKLGAMGPIPQAEYGVRMQKKRGHLTFSSTRLWNRSHQPFGQMRMGRFPT